MADQDDGPTTEQASRHPAVRHIPVRYGRMRNVGEFACPGKVKLACGATLVIATDRGIEVGQYADVTCHEAASSQKMRAYAANSGGEAYRLNDGRVLRLATDTDLIELRHIEEGTREKIDVCSRFARELGLDMRIVDCEHLFGGERIVFYFLAAERVDFRELVRRLASEYQTRIEMRQIGARDEARLLADYETCGRECCCRSLLKTLKPVSMQMAKQQKATLDPSKVSGRCGRLKCCLRYEHETYESLAKRLPRLGSWIATRELVGRVTERQVLTQLVKVADESGRVTVVPVEAIVERNVTPGARPPGRQAGASGPEPVVARRQRPDTSGNVRGNSRTPKTAADETSAETSAQNRQGPAAPLESSAGSDPTDGAAPPDQTGGTPSHKGRRRGRPNRRKRRGRPSGGS